ncbi:MAG: ribonuclease R [Candidatus Pacebacteria bacterium]|nr:ribonuclease R [Candidatus Paceibacterota bacterium]
MKPKIKKNVRDFKKPIKSIKNKGKFEKYFEGIISISPKGIGNIKTKNNENVEIDYKHLNTALNQDKVKVVILNQSKGILTGKVEEVLSRYKLGFSGVLEKEDGIYFLHPDDTKMYTDILIKPESLNGAKEGDKVYGKIISFKDHAKAPIGEIVKVLGDKGEHNAEIHSIALEKGFSLELGDDTENEAKEIKEKGITENDFKNRRDFRDTLTVTIDPYDAKDFDDAISFKKIKENEYEVGIHIADVSHYVVPGSALDNEARERATSVYLVDRTIPMLPEVLSNDLCSLVPNQDRLTMSAVFILNEQGKIKSEWYGKTIIHSDKRFTYEEAYESILNPGKEFHQELNILNKIALNLKKERFENGAISLEQEEVKFVLDEKGVPLKVVKKERTDSHKMIEELMLLANRKVAEKMSKDKNQKDIFLYRIHDKPDPDKSYDLFLFLKSLKYNVKMKDGIIPFYEINRIAKSIKNKDETDTINRAIVRSMQKAIYSTKNIGHYGLAFKYYTHFTSPIRRYPDIIVHRLLEMNLQGKENKFDRNEYRNIAISSSEQEKKATEAERASIKYKQVEYMSNHLGEVFTGIISGMNEWGLYVEEISTKCEGMVRMKDLNDDFYVLNDKKMELIGKKKGKKYKFGDRIKIKVKKVDLERKIIDYDIVK